jgi:hypothetical protein
MDSLFKPSGFCLHSLLPFSRTVRTVLYTFFIGAPAYGTGTDVRRTTETSSLPE